MSEVWLRELRRLTTSGLAFRAIGYAPPGGELPLSSTFIFEINTFIISVYETSFSGICEEDDTY